METIKNYIDITGRFQLFTKSFAYIDAGDNSTRTYLADQIFINKKLTVKFDKGELHNNGNQYIVIFCKVKKKDVNLFKECMNDLRNKMILLGYKDYDDCCKEIWDSLESCDTK